MATTSHNIANANTEGFSRQEVRNETGITINEGNYVIGTGTNIQSIKRAHDKLVEKKLNSTITTNEFNTERSTQLGVIEDVFNEINSEGLNKILNRFFNSFRELANQPENETVRGIVRENARIVIGDFHRIQDSLDHSKTMINSQMGLAITDVNKLSSKVAELNNQIAAFEVSGADANDLNDQRDLAIRSLAEYFPLSAYEDEMGRFTINVEGLGSLVSGEVAQELVLGNNLASDANSTDKKSQEIYFKSRPSYPVTDKIKGGKIGALLKTRTDELKSLEKEVNEMAYNLVKSTNAIHRKGFTNFAVPVDQNGTPLPHLADKAVTNVEFFKEPLDYDRAAEYIDLSQLVKSDVNNIATALEPNSPGDNRLAIAISKLQHEKVLNGGMVTFEEHYLKSIGNIGLQTSKARIDTEQSGGILAQVQSVKERISGVSLDEETANMVKYQNAYEASAKMIKASDDMFRAVLELV